LLCFAFAVVGFAVVDRNKRSTKLRRQSIDEDVRFRIADSEAGSAALFRKGGGVLSS